MQLFMLKMIRKCPWLQCIRVVKLSSKVTKPFKVIELLNLRSRPNAKYNLIQQSVLGCMYATCDFVVSSLC